MEVKEVRMETECEMLLIGFQFMKCLFGPSLERVVHRSTLFMLTCGPLVTFQDLFLAMKQTIARYVTFL